MSKLLSMLMAGSGGGKTLNLVSAGGATYDSDYIFEKTANDTFYFITKDTVDFFNLSNTVELKIRYYPDGSGNGIFRRENDFDFSLYHSGINQIWVIVQANSDLKETSSVGTQVWIDIDILKENNTITAKWKYSSRTEWTTIGTKTFTTPSSPAKIIFGLGTSTGTAYTLNGKIDFKETDIIINGKSVLWV